MVAAVIGAVKTRDRYQPEAVTQPEALSAGVCMPASPKSDTPPRGTWGVQSAAPPTTKAQMLRRFEKADRKF